MLRTYVGVYQQQQQSHAHQKACEEETATPPNKIVNFFSFKDKKLGNA